MSEEHFWPEEEVPPDARVYRVTIRNGTAHTFDSIVLFYKRVDQPGVVFLEEAAVTPNDLRTFVLGPCPAMQSYVLGCFIAGQMVARLPPPGQEMTPQRAAQLDPARQNPCADSWLIQAAAQLPLGQYTYQVAITNSTPDTWDEITLFYKRKAGGGAPVQEHAIAPGQTRVLQLGPCDQMESYAFGIWVGGTRVLTWPPPGTGPMTPLRASAEKPTDTDACGDAWDIYVS